MKSLRAQANNEGIIIIKLRALEEMKAHYGPNDFPILTYNDPLAYIWMQHIHEEDHTEFLPKK